MTCEHCGSWERRLYFLARMPAACSVCVATNPDVAAAREELLTWMAQEDALRAARKILAHA